MRISAQLIFLTACLAAAPAYAQSKPGVASVPQTLSNQPGVSMQTETQLNAQSPRLNLGVGFNKSTEHSLLPLAPIEKDQLEFSWKPGGKWGITLDLTSRSDNQLLPREEMAAGAYYQVTPRFRFGGSVTINGDKLTRPEDGFQKEVDEAAVRLESAFSF